MEPVKRILIVGGGSSGWMTAALLSRRLPTAQIALIEASDIPIIGVGESTNSVTRYFHDVIGVDEASFMRHSNAAFKLAIRFRNFNRLNGVFFHPFGHPESEDGLFRPRAETLHQTCVLAQNGNQFSPECSYAYQVDAGLYGQFLKAGCLERGVRHIVDRVVHGERGDDGNIARIATERTGSLEADLYVDCSGFRSFLLGKTLAEPFRSVGNLLLNDRAIATRVPYVAPEDEMKTFTDCIGLSAGWVWQIPLWSRLGIGYVYSSAFLSASDAEREFRRFLGPERGQDIPVNHIEIRAGRHERAWVGNCVAIGVSYGFLEPLESTGLSLTQVAVMDLADELVGHCDEGSRRRFNVRQGAMFDTTRDFVAAHFVLTARADTPYWRHIRHDVEVPHSLAAILDHARHGSFAPIEGLEHTFYETLNWNLILSGMGMFDAAPPVKATIPMPASVIHHQFLRDAVHAADDSVVLHPDVMTRRSAAHPMWAPTW